jgi:hypothetical protein
MVRSSLKAGRITESFKALRLRRVCENRPRQTRAASVLRLYTIADGE